MRKWCGSVLVPLDHKVLGSILSISLVKTNMREGQGMEGVKEREKERDSAVEIQNMRVFINNDYIFPLFLLLTYNCIKINIYENNICILK